MGAAGALAKTTSAQQHIAYVSHRLQRAIVDADPKGTHRDGDQNPQATRPERLRTRLRAAMGAAAEAAVPAAVAAGAVSMFFPAGHAAPIAGGLVAGATAKELLKQAVQYATAGLMGRPSPAKVPTTAAVRFQAARTRVDAALAEYVTRLSNESDAPDPSRGRLTEALRIKSISAVYGFLQAQLGYAPDEHDAACEVTDPILKSLLQAGTLDHQSNLAAVAQSLETQRQKLREVHPGT